MSFIATRRLFTTSARRLANTEHLKQQSKKNPELMVLGGVMSLTFIGAGWYFGQNPTTTGDEEAPWDDSVLARHKATKDTPSALNSVVVPSLTLPKEVHDALNKWGKDGYP